MSQHPYLQYQAADTESRLGRFLARQHPAAVVSICLLLGLAVGLTYFVLAPKTYQASTTVLVLPTASGLESGATGGRTITEISMETEAELARSAAVAADASAALGGALTTEQLLAGQTVTVPNNSQVMVVDLRASGAALARDGVTALAQAYLDQRAKQATEIIDSAQATLQNQLQTAEDRLAALSAQQPTSPGQIALNQSKRDVLVDKISDINRELLALSLQSATGGKIVSEAERPGSPANPSLYVAIGAGLVLGLGLAAALLLLASRGRAGHGTRRPLTQRQLTVLATVADEPVGESTPASADVLRRVCREVAAFPGDPGPVALVGVGDPAARTRVAVALAEAWGAEFGESVLVVTDTAAAPALPEARAARGLTDILVSRATLSDCTSPLPGGQATLIGPGEPQDLPSTFHSGHLMRLWGRLDREFGAVLVASTLEHEQPLGMMTIRTAGRIAVVVQDDETRDRDLRGMLDALDSLDSGDRLAGVVLVTGAQDGRADGGPRALALPLAPEDAQRLTLPDDPMPSAPAPGRQP